MSCGAVSVLPDYILYRECREIESILFGLMLQRSSVHIKYVSYLNERRSELTYNVKIDDRIFTAKLGKGKIREVQFFS